MSQTPACPDVPDDFDLAVQSAREAFARRYDEMGPRWRITAAAYRSGRFDDEEFGVARAIDAVQIALADRASRALPSTALAARPEEGWQEALRPFAEDTHPLKNTHLLSWLGQGWFHCQHGGKDWCQGSYLDSAKAYIEAFEAVARAATAPSTPPTAGDGHD